MKIGYLDLTFVLSSSELSFYTIDHFYVFYSSKYKTHYLHLNLTVLYMYTLIKNLNISGKIKKKVSVTPITLVPLLP